MFKELSEIKKKFDTIFDSIDYDLIDGLEDNGRNEEAEKVLNLLNGINKEYLSDNRFVGYNQLEKAEEVPEIKDEFTIKVLISIKEYKDKNSFGFGKPSYKQLQYLKGFKQTRDYNNKQNIKVGTCNGYYITIMHDGLIDFYQLPSYKEIYNAYVEYIDKLQAIKAEYTI